MNSLLAWPLDIFFLLCTVRALKLYNLTVILTPVWWLFTLVTRRRHRCEIDWTFSFNVSVLLFYSAVSIDNAFLFQRSKKEINTFRQVSALRTLTSLFRSSAPGIPFKLLSSLRMGARMAGNPRHVLARAGLSVRKDEKKWGNEEILRAFRLIAAASRCWGIHLSATSAISAHTT